VTDDTWFDQDETDWYDDEYSDSGDSSETLPCPECGADVYEDAERCPACGQYITPGSGNLWAGRSPWWIILGLLGIAAVVLALLVGTL